MKTKGPIIFQSRKRGEAVQNGDYKLPFHPCPLVAGISATFFSAADMAAEFLAAGRPIHSDVLDACFAVRLAETDESGLLVQPRGMYLSV